MGESNGGEYIEKQPDSPRYVETLPVTVAIDVLALYLLKDQTGLAGR
jgi:hypothetical protein